MLGKSRRKIRMLVQKLEEHIPLSGPGWVNWKNVRTAVLTSIAMAAMWWSWDRVVAFNELPPQVEENTKQIAQINPKLNEILVLVKTATRQQMTITGRVRIVPNGDGHACLWINELGHAAVHLDSVRVSVTNLTDPSRRKSILMVKGSISSPEEDLLGEVCAHAARMLHADGDEGNIVVVKIEPGPDPR